MLLWRSEVWTLSAYQKYSFLINFYPDLEKCDRLDPQKEDDTVSKSYNEMIGVYFDEYQEFSNPKIKKMDPKYEATNLMLNTYDYKVWFAEKEFDDLTLKGDEKEELDNVLSMPPLEEDEEVKEGTGCKVLTAKKTLTRLPVLSAQVKAGNNSYKLKS